MNVVTAGPRERQRVDRRRLRVVQDRPAGWLDVQ